MDRYKKGKYIQKEEDEKTILLSFFYMSFFEKQKSLKRLKRTVSSQARINIFGDSTLKRKNKETLYFLIHVSYDTQIK